MTAVDRPDNGQDEGRELVARCGNYREDLDQPCTGTLRFRWGMSQAACDTCGGYCGVAVARWTEVASVRAGAGEQQREQVAAELDRHQHLMGRRDDDQPQWFSWCQCGWDGGPVEPSRGAPTDVRLAFRLHVADELLALLTPQSDGEAPEPCPVTSHATDGWHCAVEGPHEEHRNAAGDFTW